MRHAVAPSKCLSKKVHLLIAINRGDIYRSVTKKKSKVWHDSLFIWERVPYMNSDNAQPLVSVIMPAFNAAQTIQESIDSVIAQSYDHWEIIVIDDKSTDTTSQIIKQAAQACPRIRFFTNTKNAGVATSRNKGIQEAKGAYIAFLDSDDLWHPDKLKNQIAFMKQNNAAISYTATAYINNEIRSNYVLRAERQLTRTNLLKRNIMSCSSVMVKREIMRKHLFPIRKEVIHEDIVSWLNILNEVGIAYGLNEPLLIYRMANNTKSSGRITSAIMTLNAYRCVGYNFIVSCLMTLRYAKHSISKRYLIKAGS